MSNVSLTQAIPMLLKAVPRSRNFEAVLLFWVAGIHAFALAQIQLAVSQRMSWDMLYYWAPPTISAWILHYVLRKYVLNADGLLLPLAFLLNGLGIAMIYRLDLAEITRGGEGPVCRAPGLVELLCDVGGRNRGSAGKKPTCSETLSIFGRRGCRSLAATPSSTGHWQDIQWCDTVDCHWRSKFPARRNSKNIVGNLLRWLLGFPKRPAF